MGLAVGRTPVPATLRNRTQPRFDHHLCSSVDPTLRTLLPADPVRGHALVHAAPGPLLWVSAHSPADLGVVVGVLAAELPPVLVSLLLGDHEREVGHQELARTGIAVGC